MTEKQTKDRALRSDDPPNPGRMNRWLGFVLLVALLARLALLAVLDPQTGIQGSDSVWYLSQGWAIAHATLDQPLRTVGPLYPLGLAVVWRLVPDAPPPAEDGARSTVVLTLIRLAQIAFSLVMVWLAYGLTLRLTSDPKAGLVVAAALGLGPAFVMEPFNILTETLFMLWLTLAIWLHVRDQVGTRGWGAALVGFALALATLTRPILLLFPAVLALHLLLLRGWRAGVRRSAIMFGAFVLTLLPWNLYLLSTTGSALPSGFSSNLWIGATGSGQWEGRAALDSRRQQFKGGDEDYLSEALGPITGRPFQWLCLRARCLAGAVLQPHGTVNLTGPSTKRLLSDWWRQDRSLSGLVAVGRSPWFWLKALIYVFHCAALVFAAPGVLIALRRWRQHYSVFAIVGYLFGAYGLLTVSPRYLFPAEVFIWVLAAVGVRWLWDRAIKRDGACESVS